MNQYTKQGRNAYYISTLQEIQAHNILLTSFSCPYLKERTLQFNGEDISKDVFLEKLKDRLASADINQVKADVMPFVRNPKELDIWSNDYFLQLAGMLRFEE